ncbi:hypothetical protein Patl1_04990 [Pistacia atlantica]|uniref:Uncharacterized protein n=1 Tax=Pistacia atlantica TaxID=434234 RepID=A0ACC1BUM4_9ROSI|nr:hypothetical protein Patl1_04990 [Pistacia atlantica]
MEMYDLKSIAVSIVLVTVVTWAWRLLNWVWFRPKKFEKYLRQQGLKGKPYRLLYGDLKENLMMIKEAKSSPLNLSDDVVPLVLPFIDKLVKEYGDNSFTWFGTVPRVIITNPNQLKEIFTKINDFQKSKARNPLVNLIATGLLEYEGEKWTKHRRIINPAFHQEKLKLMLPAFSKVCSELISEWKKLHLEATMKEGRRIFQLQTELVDLAMQAAQSFYIPGLSFYRRKQLVSVNAYPNAKNVGIRKLYADTVVCRSRHCKLLPTKRNKRIKEIDNEMRALLMDIIKNREKAMKASEAATNNDLLVSIRIGKLAQEKRCFKSSEITSPNNDGLSHLKVVSMILYEVLRLYPPIATLPRAVYKDIKLGSLSLPPGIEIFLPVILVHHDKGLWGDDAKEFKPERFSEGISKATKNQASFFPFGWGPRICIGQNFALIEAKIALAMILQKFTLELSPSYVHSPHRIITIHPEYGAQLILKKIA